MLKYINEHDPETPILTEDITKYVMQQTGQQHPDVKKAVNVKTLIKVIDIMLGGDQYEASRRYIIHF